MKPLGLFGIRATDAAALAADELFGELAGAEAVCFGEEHPNPHHHEAEHAVLRALLERARASGRELGVGLAMLSQDQQRHLDAFASGNLDLQGFDDASQWATTCESRFRLYSPLLATARSEGVALLALNAPRSLMKAVVAQGLRGLSPEERRHLPELDTADEGRYAAFEERMRHSSPARGQNAGSLNEAQLVSDATIAETATSWLAERRPLRQLVIIAGVEQCRQTAIPGRIRRRLADAEIVSALPVLNEGNASPDVARGYDYELVLTPDPAVAEGGEPR